MSGYKPKGKFDTSDAQDAVIISEIKNSPICDEYGKLDNDFVKEKTLCFRKVIYF